MLSLIVLGLLQAGPPAAAGHSLVYAGDMGVLLLNADGPTGNRMWRWDGKTWSLVPGNHPPVRSLAAVAYDPGTKSILMQGGAIGRPNGSGQVDWKPQGDALSFDGHTWKAAASEGLVPRDHHGMVYDAARKRFVLHGGTDADPSGRSRWLAETWLRSDAKWAQLKGQVPAACAHFGMAYDSDRQKTVLVGGFGQFGANASTWEFDGSSWTIAGEGGPLARTGVELAYHKKIGRIVAFGGSPADRSTPTDTWAWDGRRWTKIADTGPHGRTVHAMAYDEARGVIVLYGGAGPNELGDTWEFDGKSWTKLP